MGGEQRKELERWADALARADVAELRAAGRAIRTLCDENAELARRLEALEPSAAPPNGAGAVTTAEPSGLPARPPRRPAPRTAPRRRTAGRATRIPWRLVLAVFGVFAVAGLLVALAARAAEPGVEVEGLEDGATIGPAALGELELSTPASSGQSWTLDGRPVRPVREGDRLVLRPRRLADGPHSLVVQREGRLWGAADATVGFVVDTAPPRLRLDAPAVVRRNEPLRVRGTLEPGASLRRGSQAIEVTPEGRFELRSADVPRRLVVDAVDRAGNASRWRIPVTVVPRRPEAPVRAVHVTAYAWANDSLRAEIMRLIRERRINAVELDIKDEGGEVGWNPPVPLARRMGSALDVYDLRQSVEQLHRLGVRVIGRLVCFRDPIHAREAWEAGRRNEVVQTPGGSAYAGYEGFTNFADPAVRKYNIDIAVAAAEAGVDEILYDYVRRPDGPLDSMTFPGLRGTPERAIVEFLAQSRKALAPSGVLVGASVFGVAATRPKEVAQDIPAMAREVDYIAPMLYPSHWGPGEYDVADPNGSPYEIVKASTRDFVRQVQGTGARVVNWLQDFSLGRDYGPEEVRAQIRGSRDAGVDEFLLWDAAVTYTAEALTPDAPLPALGLRTSPPADAPGPVRIPLPKPQGAPAAARPAPTAAPAAATQPRPGLPPNELGRIPVVMHHMIRPDRVGDYDQTPAEFRAELQRLWREGYYPVPLGDVLSGRLDVPKGLTPVVLTFDDSTTFQFSLDDRGEVRPDTAVGIMLEFARTHPGFRPSGVFYVNRQPFAEPSRTRELLRWLVDHGFEIGNHTHDHIPMHQLSAREVQRQIVAGARVIEAALPGYRVQSLALPLGMHPEPRSLAVRGSWDGQRYGPYAVLLIGAEPAPSPYSRAFEPSGIPRIRSSHGGWSGEADFASAYWFDQLRRNPELRFVSDGDPETITVPEGSLDEVKPRFRARAKPRT